MSYSVLQYNQKFICDEDEYEVKISSEIKTIEEIKKVIPIMINFYDENMKINMDFYLNNEEVNKERKYFEDIDLVLKEKLGYGKSVGRWKKEEELYRLIKKIYSKYNVIYQYKPSFLYNSITKGQQSLDIYIEDLKIGIEYQGKQHYEAIEIFGGKKGLIETKKRDQEKLERCRQNGVKIIYIKYDEKITEKNIKDKISINNY